MNPRELPPAPIRIPVPVSVDAGPDPLGPGSAGLVIDCETCVMAASDACGDCVVTFILGREPGDAVVVDADEERALRALGDGGLVPRLRHRPRRVG